MIANKRPSYLQANHQLIGLLHCGRTGPDCTADHQRGNAEWLKITTGMGRRLSSALISLSTSQPPDACMPRLL